MRDDYTSFRFQHGDFINASHLKNVYLSLFNNICDVLHSIVQTRHLDIATHLKGSTGAVSSRNAAALKHSAASGANGLPPSL